MLDAAVAKGSDAHAENAEQKGKTHQWVYIKHASTQGPRKGYS